MIVQIRNDKGDVIFQLEYPVKPTSVCIGNAVEDHRDVLEALRAAHEFVMIDGARKTK